MLLDFFISVQTLHSQQNYIKGKFYESVKGNFLVATEQMRDPRFKKTVIIMLENDQNGAWGLVKVEMEYPVNIHPLFPRWSAQLIMPLGFALIALHMVQNSYRSFTHRSYLVLAVFIFYLYFILIYFEIVIYLSGL